jgi:hypothetical protein
MPTQRTRLAIRSNCRERVLWKDRRLLYIFIWPPPEEQ